jgi:hypothetical protein
MAEAYNLPTQVITAAKDKTEKPGLVGSEDFYLGDVILVTPSINISIKNLAVEISYYEDIMNNSVSGHILMSDSISLIDRLSLSGGEFLKLSFKKTQNSTAEINKYFRVYRVSERLLNNPETENYTLHFCSEELFLSEQIKVSKGYSGKKISDMVEDILVDKLKIDKNSCNIQETDGLYDFVIPYKKPYEAINWLANYARAKNGIGADYLFYENRLGFHFASLQNLFKQEAKNSYSYIPRNVGGQLDLQRNMIGIKSYTFLDTFDSLYGTTTGAFANKLISVDPLTRSYNVTNFDYIKDYHNKVNKLNNFPVINNLKNRFGKTQNQNYDAVQKVMITNANQQKALGIQEKPWTVANDIKAETYVPYRTAQLSLAHYSRIKLALSGDPFLTVGKTVNIRLPSSRSNSDGSGLNEGQKDLYNSGKYLITAVRHIINLNQKYETVIEVAKDSYGDQLTSYDMSGDINKAINGGNT